MLIIHAAIILLFTYVFLEFTLLDRQFDTDEEYELL